MKRIGCGYREQPSYPLVEAAEATPGLRSVLALFEGAVSGAADGYGRRNRSSGMRASR
jgi:thiamine pyrophosphate-dependent acetolactate synthase large subunit-like protein